MLGWDGLLIEPNPVSFGRLMVNRPFSWRTEVGVCSDKPFGHRQFLGIGTTAVSLSHLTPRYQVCTPQHPLTTTLDITSDTMQ